MDNDGPPRDPDEESIIERKSVSSIPRERRESHPGFKISFSPDTDRDRHREITTLPLTRTFSRNSYSSAKDEEEARLKKITRTRGVEPDVILPVGNLRCPLSPNLQNTAL
jgi:hypothetical protein